MPLGAFYPTTLPGPALLIGGAIALFTCSRLLLAILPDTRNSSGLRALAFFLPIAVTSLTAILLGRTEVALAVVFGTCVGALTTAMGFIALADPIGPAPHKSRRIWSFIIAASLLTLIAGFKGYFSWRDAVALLTEGIILAGLWFDRSDPAHPAADSATTPSSIAEVLNYARPQVTTPPPWLPSRTSGIALQVAIVAAAAWLGGWAATRGISRTTDLLHLSTSSLAGTVLSLSLVLPMMYGTWRAATGGRSSILVTAQVGVVLLNLCVLLPILILIPYAAAKFPAISHFAGDALAYHEGLSKPLEFPPPIWRVDNVVLVVMGVFLLPVSLGKWNVSREEGMFLIGGYFFYLLATLAQARW